VEVGRGKKSEEDILYYLKKKTNDPAKLTAPPSGLFLEKVYYDKDTVISDFNSLIRVDKFLR
ncbi:MAG: tRNA pseudouridine(38-40) synthase TruA, partial [Ignavibacterium sp.]